MLRGCMPDFGVPHHHVEITPCILMRDRGYWYLSSIPGFSLQTTSSKTPKHFCEKGSICCAWLARYTCMMVTITMARVITKIEALATPLRAKPSGNERRPAPLAVVAEAIVVSPQVRGRQSVPTKHFTYSKKSALLRQAELEETSA